jgi:hypothetical protein
MAYNEKLGNRIRKSLAGVKKVREKQMMGCLTFMVNEKMCIGIVKDELMCRIDPLLQDEVLSRKGCRIMDFTGRPMKGYVMVDDSGMRSKKDFDYFVGLCLSFNKIAKASKKKK